MSSGTGKIWRRDSNKGAQVTAVKRCLTVLLVVVMAVTVLEIGTADAHSRRRHRRQAKKNQNKNTRVEERQVSNLGVTIDFEDREPTLPLGEVLVDDDDDFFSGTITGFKNECQGRILVEVFHANGQAVGGVEASDSGSWSVTAEDPGTGGYFARATRYGTGRGARFACGKGVSNTTEFEDGDAGLI
jgi:hypothetical protein